MDEKNFSEEKSYIDNPIIEFYCGFADLRGKTY